MPIASYGRGNFASAYWTLEQMIVHHTTSGCNLRTGDLLASGTISGPTPSSRGCLLESSDQPPFSLPHGTTRRFLHSGDEVMMRAFASRPNLPRIGFGECRGTIR